MKMTAKRFQPMIRRSGTRTQMLCALVYILCIIRHYGRNDNALINYQNPKDEQNDTIMLSFFYMKIDNLHTHTLHPLPLQKALAPSPFIR